MAQDPVYTPVPLVYRSLGLTARYTLDQCPPNAYLNMLNSLERSENSLSSRYGTQIVNRDPDGTPSGQNYLFATPAVSLARLLYTGLSYRYAGLSSGLLMRRAGDTQGAYTEIASDLSGQPFQTLVTNCYQSSQPYLFIYDQAQSLKDNGTFAAPQLTGIDPPTQTANAVPYAPLLTLIDNFASGNSYSGGSGSLPSGWAYGSLVTLTPGSSSQVTDFPQFLNFVDTGSVHTATGANASVVETVIGGTATNTATSGAFASVAVPSGSSVSLSVVYSAQIAFTGTLSKPSGEVAFSYSTDNGTTWKQFYLLAPGVGNPALVLDLTFTAFIPMLANLDTILIRAEAISIIAAGSTGAGTVTTTATINSVTASIEAPGIFGDICNGMLSVLNTNSSISIPISTIVSSNLVGGLYQQLLITTLSAHGLTGTKQIAVYGSSNDKVDGYYLATVTGATTLTVQFIASTIGAPGTQGHFPAISATGGTLVGGAAAPSTCVLTQEYDVPYPTQLSAWGFYQQVPLTEASFPVGAWSGTVAQNSTATIGATVNLNLDINNQATDDDLIILTLQVGDPAAISQIELQFDVNGSGYTSTWYSKSIAPAYYQQGVEGLQDAYTTTEQQILADTLGLLTGATPGSTTAQLQPSNFSTGPGAWIACLLRRGDFLPIGQAGQSGLDWTNVTGWQVVVTTNTVGSSTIALNGLYFQWGYGPSSFAGTGYDYRYTYYNSLTGTESNACPMMAFGGQQFGYLSSQAPPFYLRQAAQVIGQYPTDTQVNYIRIYRRGGSQPQWVQIDQFPSGPTPGTLFTGSFYYKDVIPDLAVQQAQILILDNDPPVTSSLQTPINTTLASATFSLGNSIYSTYGLQFVSTTDNVAFEAGQIVLIGNPQNLEEVRSVSNLSGGFVAVVRLQHNAGEPVVCYSKPRVACDLCALAYGTVYVAGDPNNPNYLYRAKRGLPESFSPAAYTPVGGSDETINAVVNWRGTLFVATDKTWYLVPGGGAQPQPTGSIHGCVARNGWIQSESAIWYQAADGIREFTGADGRYASLIIEQVFRPAPTGTQPSTPVPLADTTQFDQTQMCYFNNSVFVSYVSTTNSGQRFRVNYDANYTRWRNDDIGATAMLWEADTNTMLVAKAIPAQAGSPAGYAVCVDQTGDYDDGGWSHEGTGAAALVQTPINFAPQIPYQDLGKPHFPKQWNVFEGDYDTQNQTLNTTLQFNTEPPTSLVLPPANLGVGRSKYQFQISPAGEPAASGVQAYSMSIQLQMSVTVAPTLYQENVYAALLADYRTSWDSYWIKMGDDKSKIVKQGYFDYTATAPITVNLYADGNLIVPYYTFTLPAEPGRLSVRQLFAAWKPRLWRIIATSTQPFQWWSAPQVDWKPIREGSTYAILELTA